jgi:hypothetical protein
MPTIHNMLDYAAAHDFILGSTVAISNVCCEKYLAQASALFVPAIIKRTLRP